MVFNKRDLKNAFSFNGNLGVFSSILFYILAISLFYLFSMIIKKDFFSLHNQIEFLKLAWFPIILYLEIVLLSYVHIRRKGSYPKNILRSIESHKTLFKNILHNNFRGYKLEWPRIFIFIIGYLAISVILYFNLEDIYFGEMLPSIIFYVLILILKILLLFFVSNMITVSYSTRNRFFFLFIGAAISDVPYIILRLIIEDNPQIVVIRQFLLGVLGFMKQVILSLPETILLAVISIGIGLVFIFFSRKEVVLLENKRLVTWGNMGLLILSTVMFSSIVIASYSNQEELFRISPILISFVMRELLFVALLIALSYFFLFNLIDPSDIKIRSPKRLTKVKGKIIGIFNSPEEHQIRDFFIRTSRRLLLLKSSNGKIYLAPPKANAFCPLHHQLYVGDKITAEGYFIVNETLIGNRKEEIKVFIPLFIKIEGRSVLRKISP